MADRRNIKVSEKTFEKLSDDKPDGVTWDHYLSSLHEWVKGTQSSDDSPPESFESWRRDTDN